MWDAFISYAREDLGLAERLHLALVQSEKTVWRDVQDIAAGEVFWSRIEDAISGSHYLLFVMTDRSLGSANCRKEIDFASQSNKRILPIDFRSVRTGSVWGEIAGTQWIYADGRFDSAVLELVQALNGIPQYRRLHTPWLVRAREWSGNNRDKSNLLRGTELAAAEQWLEQSVTLQPAPTDSQIEFIKASRTEEDSSRDRMLARRLSNQAEVLFSEGASMLEKSLLIAVESLRRQPMMGAHRVLTQGLERLPTRLPPIELPEIFAVNADPPLLATVEPDQDAIKITALSATGDIRAIRAGIDNITALEFSRSKGLLLVRYRDSFAKVIDAVSQKEILTARSRGTISQVKFSHDEKLLLVLDQTGSLQIFDLHTGATSLEMVREDWQGVTCTAFHGKWIAMQEADQDVVIDSVPDREEILRREAGELKGRDFSPAGPRFLAVPTRGGQPELWHMETGKSISSFEAHNWGVNGVAFRPQTGHLATASSDRTARLWDANGVNIQVLEHETEVFDVLWANDGNSFCTRERNGTVQWWDTLGGSLGSNPADDAWRTILGMYGAARTRMLITAAETTLERWVFGNASGPLAFLNDKNPLLTSVAFSNDR